MLGDWWRARKERRAARARLDLLNAALAIPPEQRDLARVYPVILLSDVLEAGWPGPVEPLRETPFCVGWAEVRDGNIWTYVSHDIADVWEREGVDWRRAAYRNLKAVSPGATGQKLDSAGRPFIKSMLHDDAFGPSRLLVPYLFEPELGPAYQVAIPERTCAVAFRTVLQPEDEATVGGVIEGCFRNGTEPMSPDRYLASTFWTLVEEAGW